MDVVDGTGFVKKLFPCLAAPSAVKSLVEEIIFHLPTIVCDWQVVKLWLRRLRTRLRMFLKAA